MRAAVLQARPNPLDIVEMPDPSPAAGELLVRVDSCGICGSDLHMSDAFDLPGVVLGHEFSGTVVDHAADVEGWSAGDALAGLSLATCGHCEHCLAGRVRKCTGASMVGGERPGAYAEYLTLPAHDARRLPEGFDTPVAALTEPLSVALHAIERGGVGHHDDVLVIGAGPVGLAVVAWLDHLGVRSLVASDPSPVRRATAETLGAAAIDPGTGEAGATFRDLTGRPPDVVIECVGLPGLMGDAIEAAAVDSRVVIAGVCMHPDTFFPLTAMSKELDLRFTFYYRRQDFDYTIDMIHHGRFDPRRLITSEIGLDALPERFEELKSPASHDHVKVLVRP